MTEAIDRRRRRLLGTAAMTIAAAELGFMDSVGAITGTASRPCSPSTLSP